MDPISLVKSLVSLAQDIANAVERVECNHKRSKSLSSRACAIIEVVRALPPAEVAARDVLLVQLLDVLRAVLRFVQKLQEKSYLIKLWRRNSDSDQFVAFDEELLQLQQSVTLAVIVDADARAAQRMEDAMADIKKDIEGAKEDNSKLASEMMEEVKQLLTLQQQQQQHQQKNNMKSG